MSLLRLRVGSLAVPNPPASVSSPVVGTSLTSVWNLQATGATGPRYAYSNGTWSGSPDSYLTTIANCTTTTTGNGDVLFTVTNGSSIVIEKYNFTGAPSLCFYGNNITVTIRDCYFPTGAARSPGITKYALVFNEDTNRNAQTSQVVTAVIEYCDFNSTAWSIPSTITLEQSYCRIRNQADVLGYAGGNGISYPVKIYLHHNYITGGGLNPPTNQHMEYWQHIFTTAGTGSYMYFRNNMVDFTVDGQATQAAWGSGWTGIFAEGGDCALDVASNIFKGLDVVAANPNNPNEMGTILAYGDANVTAGCTMTNNAMSCSPTYGYSFKHGGGSLFPTVSGNRTFRDSASNGIVGGPSDNTALVLADFS